MLLKLKMLLFKHKSNMGLVGVTNTEMTQLCQ